MDAASWSINIELNYDNFTLDLGTVLQNQFYQHLVYQVASIFLFILKNQEGFGRKSLVADISASDVDAVVRLCPYFAVEGKRVDLKLLVRKNCTSKMLPNRWVDYGLSQQSWNHQKGRDGILELNLNLFN